MIFYLSDNFIARPLITETTDHSEKAMRRVMGEAAYERLLSQPQWIADFDNTLKNGPARLWPRHCLSLGSGPPRRRHPPRTHPPQLPPVQRHHQREPLSKGELTRGNTSENRPSSCIEPQRGAPATAQAPPWEKRE